MGDVAFETEISWVTVVAADRAPGLPRGFLARRLRHSHVGGVRDSEIPGG